MLHTSLGIPSNQAIHLSFSLPLQPSSICFRRLIAVSLYPMCEVLLIMPQYVFAHAVYVQYVSLKTACMHVSLFAHCSAPLSLNQDML